MAMSNCKECGKAVSTLAKTCPSCGVPKPAKVLKKKTIKKTKKEQEPTWVQVHCANYGCDDHGQMDQIPSGALGVRICGNCKQYLKEGKPAITPRKRVKKKSKPDDNINTEWKTPTQIDYEIDPGSSGYAEYIKQNPDYEKQKTKVQNTSVEGNVFDKFADGHLDLATAFWGFGVFGSMIVGVVCGALSEAVGSFFNWVYFVVTFLIIRFLWGCAENHKKIMAQKKQSSVWGGLTQAFCVFSGLGLVGFVFELF